MHGTLTDMALPDLIQHNCMEEKTARLILSRGNQTATIYFEKGELTHAEYGKWQGEEAIYQVIGWEDGDFDLEMGISSPKSTITLNWSGVLLEGVRRLDEQMLEPDSTWNLANETGIEPMAQKIEDILKEMAGEITGHISSTVVGMDALNIAIYTSEKVDTDLVSAQMTLLMKLVDTSIAKIDATALFQDNLLTTKNAYLLMYYLPNKQHFLGIIADRKTAILGNLRLMAKIYSERIAKAMPR
jgi:predicted regulator of Ras-like GTPase activity (Roadblock/LC7/MglB family)